MSTHLTERGADEYLKPQLITTGGDDRIERTLSGDAEILQAYRTNFGIELDRVPTV
jgi:N-hydroxyarylamine O-acetyltransferase